MASGDARRRGLAAVAILAAAALLLALWRLTPLGEVADLERLAGWLASLRGEPWAIPAVWLGFVVGGLVLVPVNLMFLAVGIAFGFWKAVGLSLSGALLSTAVLLAVGRRFDVDPLLARAPERLRRWKERGLENADTLELAMIRFLPLGPFSTMTLLWGAARVRPGRALLASGLGLLPGVLATSLVGEGVGLAREDLTGPNLALLGAGCLAFLALVWLGRRWLATRKGPFALEEPDDQ